VRGARLSMLGMLCAVLLLNLSLAGWSSTGPFQSTMTPRQILARMAAAYVNCTSYRDEGKVVSIFEEISFATVFERPSSFRFEYRRVGTVPDNYVIWRTEPGAARSWWTIRPETRSLSLDLATAGAIGLSASSSHNIPRLLMPGEVTGFSFASINWVDTPPESESVNGRACYKLSGHYPLSPDSPVSLWIDKETFLIRKVVANSATITYSPQLNVSINRAEFQFQPPVAILSR
jgi:outer membrane lipoprotein-sorting protein